MTQVEQIANFARNASYDSLSNRARDEIRIRILDSLGCAIGALNSELIQRIRHFAHELGGEGRCRLIGGGSSRFDLAALLNAATVRYLDFNDSYLAKGETCHPSDNLGALLSAGEYADASGRELMTALAVAYQVQCRLSDEAPVRAHGFDHTVQGAYGASAGISRILGLTSSQIANAIAISATALNALRSSRTGMLSNWKGLAFPHMSADCVRNSLLAKTGITGPLEVIEGEKGLMDTITGPFKIDWPTEKLDRIAHTTLKKYNSEIHSQTSIEAALQLRSEYTIEPSSIDHVEVKVFDVAFNIIGGGEEGDKHTVQTKEQADHSLPYLVAVALLDGQVLPAQYMPERIVAADVQELIKKVTVQPDASFSRRFPGEMPAQVSITLRSGKVLEREIASYEGSQHSPMSWDAAYAKFARLTEPNMHADQRDELADLIANIEKHKASELMTFLTSIHTEESHSTVVAMRR